MLELKEEKTVTDILDKYTEAQKILWMIENVSVDDAGALDEIDARFYAWFKCVQYATHEGSGLDYGDCYGRPLYTKLYTKPKKEQRNGYASVKPYTRSRDALKSIRPEGWCFEMGFTWPDVGNEFTYKAFNRKLGLEDDCEGRLCDICLTANCVTEELAELHAIIQAIEYERSKHNKC